MYSEEELKALSESESELTEEELLLLLGALHTTLTGIENEIRLFYQKYGKDGVVTYSEAKKWVSSTNHVKRLVLFNQTIQGVFESGFSSFENHFSNHLRTLIKKEATFFGVDLDIDDILNTVWGADNSTWLKRLLAHQSKWTTILNNDLKVSILKQDSLFRVLSQTAKRGESMETILKRLWRTESSAISSISRQKAYKQLGITKYQFVHMDGCTCAQCSDLDGRIFPVSEYVVGVTANPLHPNCNDITVPVVDE